MAKCLVPVALRLLHCMGVSRRTTVLDREWFASLLQGTLALLASPVLCFAPLRFDGDLLQAALRCLSWWSLWTSDEAQQLQWLGS
jgi:hypothetical protein